jgi:hypothetical protein
MSPVPRLWLNSKRRWLAHAEAACPSSVAVLLRRVERPRSHQPTTRGCTESVTRPDSRGAQTGERNVVQGWLRYEAGLRTRHRSAGCPASCFAGRQPALAWGGRRRFAVRSQRVVTSTSRADWQSAIQHGAAKPQPTTNEGSSFKPPERFPTGFKATWITANPVDALNLAAAGRSGACVSASLRREVLARREGGWEGISFKDDTSGSITNMATLYGTTTSNRRFGLR